MTARLLGVAILVGAAWEAPVQGQVRAPGDSYLCYTSVATPAGPRFEPISRRLEDGLGSGTFRVRRVVSLCQPARTDQEASPQHPTVHLLGYAVRGPVGARFRRSNQVVYDRFGSHALAVLRPETLLVPSTEGVIGSTTDPGLPPARTVDHFACHAVRRQKGSPRVPPSAPPLVSDEFGTVAYRLRKITRLCAPVNENGGDPSAPGHLGHLLCYQARARGGARFAARTAPVRTRSFGFAVVRAKRPAELCLPAARGCPALCGNGLLDAGCAESCECGPSYPLGGSCMGAMIFAPANAPPCRRCTGCQVDDAACVVTPTTGTASTSTSTTTTTTTTAPPCTCGDAVVDLGCGERCECSVPGQTSCTGAFIGSPGGGLLGSPGGSVLCQCKDCQLVDPTCLLPTTTTTTTMPMPPTFVRRLGESHNNITDRTQTSLSLMAQVDAGDSIIVTFAMDPVDGEVSCSDSQGNVYSQDADSSRVGSRRRGVRVVVCAAHGVRALGLGDEIVVDHPRTRSQALSASEFRNVDMLDRKRAGRSRSKFPNSGQTAMTTAPHELVISAIGVDAPTSMTFDQGSGFTLLDVSRDLDPKHKGAHASMFPAYRIVSVSGRYNTSATLNKSRRWAAVIVTYK
jgi:hypothetical protein